eukprot:358894_1
MMSNTVIFVVLIIASCITVAGTIKYSIGLFHHHKEILFYDKILMFSSIALNMVVSVTITSILFNISPNNTFPLWMEPVINIVWSISKLSLFFTFHGKLYYSFTGAALFKYKSITFKACNFSMMAIYFICLMIEIYTRSQTDVIKNLCIGVNTFRVIYLISIVYVLLFFNIRLYKLSLLSSEISKTQNNEPDFSTTDTNTQTQTSDCDCGESNDSSVFMELLVRNSLLWLFVLIAHVTNSLIWVIGTQLYGTQFQYLFVAYTVVAADVALNTCCILLGCPICHFYYNLCCKRKKGHTFCHKYCQLFCSIMAKKMQGKKKLSESSAANLTQVQNDGASYNMKTINTGLANINGNFVTSPKRILMEIETKSNPIISTPI